MTGQYSAPNTDAPPAFLPGTLAAHFAGPAYAIGYSGPLPLAAIVADPDNDRAALPDVPALAASIRQHGQIEPLLCYPVGDGSYLLASGHRRRAALAQMGAETALVLVVAPPADAPSRIVRRLLANITRADLSPVDLAKACQALVATGLTQAQVGARIGIKQAAVSKLRGLLELPEQIQQWVVEGKLTPSHIEQITRITEAKLSWDGRVVVEDRDATRIRLASQAVQHSWPVGELRKVVGSEKAQQECAKREAAREVERARKEAALPPAARATREATAQTQAQTRQAEDEARNAARLAADARITRRRTAVRAAVGGLLVDAAGGLTLLGWRYLALKNGPNPATDVQRAAYLEAVAQAATPEARLAVLVGPLAGNVALDYQTQQLSPYPEGAGWLAQQPGVAPAIRAALAAADAADPAPTGAPAEIAAEASDSDHWQPNHPPHQEDHQADNIGHVRTADQLGELRK